MYMRGAQSGTWQLFFPLQIPARVIFHTLAGGLRLSLRCIGG